MRRFAFLLLCFSFSFSAFADRALFEHEGLSKWYLQLQNFEQVDLNSPLLEGCSAAEFRFAAIQYHWQSLLRGGPESHYQSLQRLSKEPLTGDFSLEEKRLSEVLTAFFLARAAALQGESLSSLTAYTGASAAMEKLLQMAEPGSETLLLNTIYSLGYQQLNSNPLYWTLLAWLPSPPKKMERNDLSRFKQHASPILRTEAAYFAFRIYKDEDPRFAKQKLAQLQKRFPKNWIYRLEYYRNFEMDEDEEGLQMKKLQAELSASAYLSRREKAHFKVVLAEM